MASSSIVVFHRLCNDLPTWMGVMLFAYNLNNCNYLLRGNASDQKKLLFARSMQFLPVMILQRTFVD